MMMEVTQESVVQRIYLKIYLKKMAVYIQYIVADRFVIWM